MILKKLQFKKWNRIKGQKVHKQVRDQRNGVQVSLENENKSKGICYAYSDCYHISLIATVKIGYQMLWDLFLFSNNTRTPFL